ncbi:MAG: hypothetical protein HC805_03480 [Alkalinema sp. RL_2_19]|nr:hypothetical protein [Alkalinema sp. RL_2_19]
MVAGMAHEINNPVSFIHGNIEYATQYTQQLFQLIALYQQHHPESHPDVTQLTTAIDLEFMRQDLPQLLASMRTGSERIQSIVQSLRHFAHLDESGIKIVDLHDGD